MVVLVDMMVDISWFVCWKEGFCMWSLFVVMWERVLLLRIIIELVFWVRCFMVSMLLYGCIIMLLEFVVLGNMEYVWMIFLGNLLFNFLSRKEFKFEFVFLVIECSIMKFLRELLLLVFWLIIFMIFLCINFFVWYLLF